MTLAKEEIVDLGDNRSCTVVDASDSFIEVVFSQRPTCEDYDLWFKRGYRPLFSPKERTCNRGEFYDVIFKATRRQAPDTPVSSVTPRFSITPALGQKAWINNSVEGRVASFIDEFPNQYVEVMTIHDGITMHYAPQAVYVENSLGVRVKVQEFVPHSDLSSRDKDKVTIQQSIHHLRSLLDSEAEFEESAAVANKAYEALGRL